jgi:tRNA (pseudouridine54-N1)-methyltransferase
MRQFIVVGHDAPTTSDFSLDGLPGAGRLDVLCKCVTSALLVSHDIREDVQVSLVLDDALTIRFDGATLRGLHPDERSTAALIRTALEQREEAVGHMEVETSPGVFLSRRDFATTLSDAASDGTVVELHEDGTPVVDVEPPENPVFVLSDNRDFTDGEAEHLASVADRRIRLGPRRLHADQAITVAHNYLDTGGFRTY